MNAKKAILDCFSQEVPRPLISHIPQIAMPKSHPEGKVFSDLGLAPGEKVYGVYREKYYLTTQRLIIKSAQELGSIPYESIVRIKTLWGGIENPHHIIVLQDGTQVEVKEPEYVLNLVVNLLDRLRPKAARVKAQIIGPPHLQPYAIRISPRIREAFGFESNIHTWQRVIRCNCGSLIFTIRYLGNRIADGLITDPNLDRQRVELTCASCSKAIELFDGWRHGYNAIICEEFAKEPKGREVTAEYACSCGANQFTVAIQAQYSLDRNELADLNPEQWNHTFDWFRSLVQCSNCRTVATLVDYECA